MSDRFSFMSKYPHVLDDKGRLALPGKLRDELAKSARPEELVALPNAEKGMVALYPYERWQKVEASFHRIEDSDQREITIRHFQGNSERITLDKAGRLLLPQRVREMAGLEREVAVIGALYKIEIWPRQVGDEFAARQEFTKPDPSTIRGLDL
ncbi:MAG: hypothetical protein LBP55_05565 [Candidatus Adiutrix sp.]|jgi:MraZ protein|nr:hypothetical protein [Candidatus Adiutrix sp.]